MKKKFTPVGTKICTTCGIKYKGTTQSTVCNTCGKQIISTKYDLEISSQLKRNKTRITKWYHTNEYVNYTRGDLLDILNRYYDPPVNTKVTCCFSSLKMLKVLAFIVNRNEIYDDETFLNAIELLDKLKGCIIGRNRLVILAGIIYWDKRNKFSQPEVGRTFFISDVSIRNIKPIFIQFGLAPYMRSYQKMSLKERKQVTKATLFPKSLPTSKPEPKPIFCPYCKNETITIDKSYEHSHQTTVWMCTSCGKKFVTG